MKEYCCNGNATVAATAVQCSERVRKKPFDDVTSGDR